MSYLDAGAPTRSEQPSRKRLIPPLVYRRLPWWAELGIIFIGYLAYTRSRVAAPTKERAAYFHASQVWDLERLLHIDIELALNRVVAAFEPLGYFVGYYYGTLHFVVTPAVLIWLWLRRPAAYPRLRSTIIITTFAALVTYWTWPLAPPRFALGGATDIAAQLNIFGAGDPQGVSTLVNLYAAMPSLHCGWAIWCALAVYTTTNGRWRKLVWIYPLATCLVVIGSANHYVLDAVGGALAVGLGWYLTRPVGPRKAKAKAPVESIATGAPLERPFARHPRASATPADDTDAVEATVLDHQPDDGTIVDVRRSTPTPPSTER